MSSNTILIYAEGITPRVKYIFDLIFRGLLHVTYEVVVDVAQFEKHEGVKLSYSEERIGDSFHVCPVHLLFETGLSNQQEEMGAPSVWEGVKIFYKTASEDFPFDVFAASFYLVTRYEEYLKIRKDKYGRFSASSSLAYKYGFLKEPVVNIWAIHLAQFIQQKYPSFQYRLNEFRHLPTIDIDNAWAYKNRGLRGMLMLAKSLMLFRFKDFSTKLSIISGQSKDPYDSYDLMDAMHSRSVEKPIFFFLVADRSRYDRAVSYKNAAFRELVKKTAENNRVGLHAGYASNEKSSKIDAEKSRLEEITGCPVVANRQHYIKLRFPYTYRKLVKAGIKEDYSMGYASKIGFRAGICEPFLFFDVANNCQTDLMIYPFQIMDVSLSKYLGLRSNAAIDEIQKMKKTVRDVGGLFVTLWHNESLSVKCRWRSWRKVYESVFE